MLAGNLSECCSGENESRFDRPETATYYAAMKSPHTSTELLSEMIGLIYEAAADLSLWPQLLESMSEYLELSLPDAAASKPRMPHVNQAERSLLNLLAPHFERANAIHQQLAEVTEERNLLEKFMNRLPLGAAIIDARCNAVSMNRTLISLLQTNVQLRLVDGRLVSVPSHALEHAVEKILSGGAADEMIRLGDAESGFSLWISRGGVSASSDTQPSRLMVFVASRTSHALSEAGLITLFGLTPAEARVTQKLALGYSVEESAELLAVSKNTVKTLVARVFGKVGVKKQTELMQAIYASPLWLQSDLRQTAEVPLAVNGVQLARHESEELRMRLSDGRSLSFSDSGDANGHPVIFMHGIAGSRHLRHPDDDILMREGIRLIIPERPGSGDSDVQPERRVTDWPQSIAELANHLGLQQFSVLGYSAGTSYALAVASAMPQRVRAVHLVAAVSPLDDLEDLRAYNPVFRMTLFVARYTPGLLPALMRVMVKDIRQNVYQYLEKIFADAPEQDREVLAHPRLRANIAAGLRASVQHNEQEIAREVLLFARNWELDLSKANMPVHIWYGENDPMVSPSAAAKLLKLLPHAQLITVPAAGHYLLYSHWQDILRTIRAAS
jgi:pimeloyl-ACP methyl ester carboxylesterase/DNA-binding CsgD family transcriptional regulator